MPPLPPRPADRRLRDVLANPFARAAILWIFLLVLFVVLWQAFGTGAPGDTGTEIAETWRKHVLQYAPLFVPAAVLGLLYWRLRTFAAANKRAVDLMASGDSRAAAEAFRRLSRAALAPAGVARVNLGLALLRLGDLRGALDAFADPPPSRRGGDRPAAPRRRAPRPSGGSRRARAGEEVGGGPEMARYLAAHGFVAAA
jgi:hypothetical protein